MITLFTSTSTVFTSNGIGSLRDIISCNVTEERNGGFELELVYPITGRYYSELSLRRIIFTKPNPYSNPQPFRIYSISKPINGIVTINAHHISYDASGYPVSPFKAVSISDALTKMKIASTVPCPFTFTTNKSNNGDMEIVKPVSMRSILGNEILDTYGGEYEFDGMTIMLHEERGQNRGVSISYGKNLMDLRQEENCASVYTGVYPFWYSEDDGLIDLTQKIVNAPGSYDFVRIYPLDLSQVFSSKPTSEQQIINEANNFISNNNLGIPKISISVSFVQLSQTEEYKNFATLETVKLCDHVNIRFPELGVDAVAQCTKTIYNVLTNKYDELELGDVKSNIVTSIVDNRQTTDSKIKETNARLDKEVGTIKIGLADIDSALINKADISVLEAGYAHLINGYIDMAQIDHESVGTSHIAKLAVGDAQISDLKAGKINSGQLNTNKVDIVSEDGRLIIKGNSQLIYDYINNDLLQPYLRVQLGKLFDVVDGELVPRTGNNNYGFEVRDADGQTVMIDGEGVHSEGITPGAVNNAHIAPDAAIDGAKLDIATVVTAINDGTTTIQGSKIYLDNTTLDVEISGIKDTQTDNTNAISTHESEINALQDQIVLKVSNTDFEAVKNDIVYKVDIVSTNGSVFKNGDISTTLQAKVYHGITEVTDTIDSNYFRWKRVSSDTNGDTAWNTAHFGGTKSVIVTSADVKVRATFTCEITGM